MCISDIEVHEEVTNETEWFQILQHAFLYDFDYIVLAISDNQSFLIQSAFINFPTDLKRQIGIVVNKIKDKGLEWPYLNNANPQQRSSKNKVLVVPNNVAKIVGPVKTLQENETKETI